MATTFFSNRTVAWAVATATAFALQEVVYDFGIRHFLHSFIGSVFQGFGSIWLLTWTLQFLCLRRALRRAWLWLPVSFVGFIAAFALGDAVSSYWPNPYYHWWVGLAIWSHHSWPWPSHLVAAIVYGSAQAILLKPQLRPARWISFTAAGWLLGFLLCTQIPVMAIVATQADSYVSWLMAPVEWTGIGWFPKRVFGFCLGLSTGPSIEMLSSPRPGGA